MAKVEYWNKILIEFDTETGKSRIKQAFSQLAAGYADKKKPKKKKIATPVAKAVEEVML